MKDAVHTTKNLVAHLMAYGEYTERENLLPNILALTYYLHENHFLRQPGISSTLHGRMNLKY